MIQAFVSIDRRVRLVLWIVAVAGSLIGAPLFLAGRATGAAVAFGAWGALLALLLTTPADAIKLRPMNSVVAILAGTTWIYGWAVTLTPMSIAWAVGAVLLTGVMLTVAVGMRVSAWWVTLPAWCPGAVAYTVYLSMLPTR